MLVNFGSQSEIARRSGSGSTRGKDDASTLPTQGRRYDPLTRNCSPLSRTHIPDLAILPPDRNPSLESMTPPSRDCSTGQLVTQPLIQKFRTAAYAIVMDDELKKWFDDFLGNLRRSLTTREGRGWIHYTVPFAWIRPERVGRAIIIYT